MILGIREDKTQIESFQRSQIFFDKTYLKDGSAPLLPTNINIGLPLEMKKLNRHLNLLSGLSSSRHVILIQV